MYFKDDSELKEEDSLEDKDKNKKEKPILRPTSCQNASFHRERHKPSAVHPTTLIDIADFWPSVIRAELPQCISPAGSTRTTRAFTVLLPNLLTIKRNLTIW